MVFNIGDRVVLLNEVGGGIIKSFSGNVYTIIDEDGFERELCAGDFIVANNLLYQNLDFENTELQEKLSADLPKQSICREGEKQIPPPRHKNDCLEIDLHIQELVDHISHLTNYEIVTIQLKHFMQFLEEAREKKYQKLIVIHGLGQGVLKSEIRDILNKLKNCSYRDADFTKYGLGATEINLWYN